LTLVSCTPSSAPIVYLDRAEHSLPLLAHCKQRGKHLRQDDGKDLLDLWQGAVSEATDPLRRLAEIMLQELLEEEMTAHLRAEPA
jgi:hypothetical protein